MWIMEKQNLWICLHCRPLFKILVEIYFAYLGKEKYTVEEHILHTDTSWETVAAYLQKRSLSSEEENRQCLISSFPPDT